jgi:hypothetical protein
VHPRGKPIPCFDFPFFTLTALSRWARCILCPAVSGSLRRVPCPQNPENILPEYVYKPNVSAEIWGVLLKTGEYADFRFFFTMLFAHTGLLCRGWCDGFGRCCGRER